MIRAENVSFAYATTPILDGISLDLRAGEITCLLGGSGCGKTTLLKLLAGLLEPHTGTIASDFPRPGNGVGYMQQNAGLLPWRTAAENVALGLQLTQQKIDDAKIHDVLAQVGLHDKIDALPGTLSGGQQQRVALARQLVLNPKILLLDEPLGALDVVLRNELANLIRDTVKRNNITALVVTHQPDDALFLADRICVMKGTPTTLTHQWTVGKDINPETGYTQLLNALAGAA